MSCHSLPLKAGLLRNKGSYPFNRAGGELIKDESAKDWPSSSIYI
jgi:hypothetical protein